MPETFAEAWIEVERGQILEACHAMALGRRQTDFVVRYHRWRPDGLSRTLAGGGCVLDYVGQVVELLPPQPPGWTPTRRAR